MKAIYELNNKQIEELHQLYQNEWWTEGRTLAETKKCVEDSQVCIGLIDSSGRLQGFARVLTDYTFKALIFDVIVSKDYRGTSLGNKLMELIKDHEKLRRVKHFELYCLPEMFSFYEKHGFSSNVGKIQLMRYDNQGKSSRPPKEFSVALEVRENYGKSSSTKIC